MVLNGTRYTSNEEYESALTRAAIYSGCCYTNWTDFLSLLEVNSHHHEESHVLPCKDFANNIVSKLAQYKAPQHVIDAFLKTCRSEEQGRLLLTACKLGASAEATQPLMNVNPNLVDLQDSWGRTPLSYAVALDPPNPILVVKLLKAFPDMIGTADNEGRTPLIHCVMNNANNNKIVLQKLLECDATIASVADQSGRLPLHYLCERTDSSLEELKLLLKAHPLGSIEPDNHGNTALHCTWEVFIEMNANHGHLFSPRDAVLPKLFLNKALSDLSSRVHVLLLAATTQKCDLEDEKSWSPVGAAAKVGDKCPWNLVQFLLKIYFEDFEHQDSDGMMALHHIAAGPTRRILDTDACSATAVQAVLRQNPNAARSPNNVGHLPLHIAAARSKSRKRSKKDIRLRKDALTQLDMFGMSNQAFQLHGGDGDCDLLQILDAYKDGASVSDNEGRLPLHHAVASGKVWSGGCVSALFDMYPQANSIPDPVTKLVPFMTAAVVAGLTDPDYEAAAMDTIYHLLKVDPTVVAQGITETEPEPTVKEIEDLKKKRSELIEQISVLNKRLLGLTRTNSL